MPRALFEDVITYLRHAAALGADGALTDAQLLDRFLTQREETAFTFLVQRHGPMILGVGRRVLGDAHEAEDVLQATFLILARRTRSIGGKRSIGGWLHGVAHHVALKAKAASAARRKREMEVGTMPSARPFDELTCQELRAALDDAIASLPEKYRASVVLCDLEGKSYDQAAQELGCPKTTLARRLAQARELLRKKLVHRGIGLNAAALATTLADVATASPMPAMLTIKTVKAAGLVVAGKSVVGCLSAGAIALAEEAMIVAKGKLVLMVMVMGLVVGGVGWAGIGGTGGKFQPDSAREMQSLAAESDANAFHVKRNSLEEKKSPAPAPRDLEGDMRTSVDNLKSIGLAMHSCAGDFRHFPPAAIFGKNNNALLSWRVAILPYVGQSALFKEFKLEEAWDSPHNHKLLVRMPALYAPPGIKTGKPYSTFYRVFVGPGTIFESAQGCRIGEITDGTSSTLLVIEAGQAVPWTKPEELPYQKDKALPALGGVFNGDAYALVADGSVMLVDRNPNARAMHFFIQRNDGNLFNPNDVLKKRP